MTNSLFYFFFNYQATTNIYPLSLHNALPIFIQEPPSGDLQERVLIRHHDYDQCFQSVQLLQWNSQVKFNLTIPLQQLNGLDRKSGSAGMPRPISYAVFCLKKKNTNIAQRAVLSAYEVPLHSD